MVGGKDWASRVTSSVAIPPSGLTTTTVTGPAIDTVNRNGVLFVLQVGTATDGTYDITIQDSADGSTGWATVAAGEQSGAFTQVTSVSDSTVQEVDYLPLEGAARRYVRLLATVGGAPATGIQLSAVAIAHN